MWILFILLYIEDDSFVRVFKSHLGVAGVARGRRDRGDPEEVGPPHQSGAVQVCIEKGLQWS